MIHRLLVRFTVPDGIKPLARIIYEPNPPVGFAAGLKDAGGQAFTGVDATGVWILALSCSVYCSSPAPWYLTVLKPCD